MAGWYRWLHKHEFEQALGVGEGQGSLACCSPWGRKELGVSEHLNFTKVTKKRVQWTFWLTPWCPRLHISVSQSGYGHPQPGTSSGMILGHFSAGNLQRKASLCWDIIPGRGALSSSSDKDAMPPFSQYRSLWGWQKGKRARVLDGATKWPALPTPQPAWPLDSRWHEIINFLSICIRMSQTLFPFHQKQPACCKKANPNSGLSDDEVRTHSKSFLVQEVVSLGITSWRVFNSTAALALQSYLD